MPETTPPGADLDLRDPVVVSDLFRRAAEAMLHTRGRAGSVVDLPARGRLTMTGDLHDHGENLMRILRLARLEASDEHYVVLHEVIHGSSRLNNADLSIRMLARIAALKCQYPAQVLVLMSNHELAQLNGEDILKGGQSSIDAFSRGMDYLYRDQSPLVVDAMNDYLRSLLLAVRTEQGIFCAHSLPAPRKLAGFDTTVIDRVPTDEDLRGGAAYDMVWGRNHNDDLARTLAQAWGVDQFLLGHQPADMGVETEGQHITILASDHAHGVALPVDLSQRYDQEMLLAAVRPLAGVRL